MATIKPVGSIARNACAVGADRLLIGFLANEGSGSAITGYGIARTQPTNYAGDLNGTVKVVATSLAGAPTWLTDSPGIRPQLGTTHYIEFLPATTELSFPRLTIKMDFLSTVSAGDTTLREFVQSSNTNNDGRLQFFKSTADVITCRFRSGGANLDATWPTFTFSNLAGRRNQFKFRCSPKWGKRVWLNGVEATYGTGFRNNTNPVKTHTSSAWWINRSGSTGAGVTLYSFELFGDRLRENETLAWEADPYIYYRPAASESNCPKNAAKTLCGKTWFDAVIQSGKSLSGTLYLRVAYAASLALLESTPSYSDTWSTTTAHDYHRFHISTMAEGARLVYRVEQSSDGVTFYARCGGHQYANLVDTTRDPNWCTISDPHFNDKQPVGFSTPPPAYGLDIALSDTTTRDESGSAIQKQWAADRTCLAMWIRNAGVADFVVDMGDTRWFDNACNVYGLDTFNERMWDLIVAHENQHYLALCLGSYMEIDGNHDGTSGQYSVLAGTVSPGGAAGPCAVRMQATVIRNMFTSNPGPTEEAYGDGVFTATEYNTKTERNVTLMADFPEFVPSRVYTLGERVKPKTGAYRTVYGYEVTTAGTASTEPSWTTTNGNTSTTGSVTFTKIHRWDAEARDTLDPEASGLNSTTLRNYFAFTWGSRLSIFFADSESYGLKGKENAIDADDPADYEVGTTQLSQALTWIRGCRASVKIFKRHKEFGGRKYIASSEAWDGRSAARTYGDADYYVSKSTTEPWQQVTLYDLFYAYGIIVAGGHDHKAFYGVTTSGVNSLRCPTSGASNMMTANFGGAGGLGVQGWDTETFAGDYGTAESTGTLTGGGETIANNRWLYNVVGYVEASAGPSGLNWSIVETVIRCNPKSAIGTLTRVLTDIPRMISPTTYTPSGGDITLTDSLNPSPDPWFVGMVCLDTDNTTVCSTGYPTPAESETLATANVARQLHAPTDASLSAWITLNAFAAGSFVSPTTYCGMMAYTSAGGTSDVAEPNWTSGSKTIGDTVTDGTITWVLLPMAQPPFPMAPGDHATTLTLKAGTTAAVRAQWAPRVVVKISNLLPTMHETTIGGMRIRKMSMRMN